MTILIFERTILLRDAQYRLLLLLLGPKWAKGLIVQRIIIDPLRIINLFPTIRDGFGGLNMLINS